MRNKIVIIIVSAAAIASILFGILGGLIPIGSIYVKAIVTQMNENNSKITNLILQEVYGDSNLLKSAEIGHISNPKRNSLVNQEIHFKVSMTLLGIVTTSLIDTGTYDNKTTNLDILFSNNDRADDTEEEQTNNEDGAMDFMDSDEYTMYLAMNAYVLIPEDYDIYMEALSRRLTKEKELLERELTYEEISDYLLNKGQLSFDEIYTLDIFLSREYYSEGIGWDDEIFDVLEDVFKER